MLLIELIARRRQTLRWASANHSLLHNAVIIARDDDRRKIRMDCNSKHSRNKGTILKPLIAFFSILPLISTLAHADLDALTPPVQTGQDVVVLKDPENLATYLLAPGDALEISVWKEEGLQQQQILISPDGTIVYPLIGTITAAGRTINDLKELITVKLSDYIADPSVSVKLLGNQGNAIFVIGKVNKPGQVNAGRRIDVLQALSLAGGLTVFADDDDISIQRRTGDKVQVFPFDYSSVIDGDKLEQNILLEPGDTVTVP